jgi:broad specificity phosphatase PhoE
VAQKWPNQLWIVRHGQSAGNVARDAAEANGLALIDIKTRDVDTPLSALGEEQSQAVKLWFAGMSEVDAPNVILCSPYVRARQTAEFIRSGLGDNITFVMDERLREKEFGILDRLTRHGIEQKFPELSEQRVHVGKFYFRPPGGESWCDVILRLRSLVETITREYAGERVLIVCHQVIVNCARYLLERMDEGQILDIDRQGDIPNCAVTSYTFDSSLGREGKLRLDLVNFVAPLHEQGAPVTAEPDQQVAPKS